MRGGRTGSTGPAREPDYRFSFANERTFLAWARTALALLAGGVALDVISLSVPHWCNRLCFPVGAAVAGLRRDLLGLGGRGQSRRCATIRPALLQVQCLPDCSRRPRRGRRADRPGHSTCDVLGRGPSERAHRARVAADRAAAYGGLGRPVPIHLRRLGLFSLVSLALALLRCLGVRREPGALRHDAGIRIRSCPGVAGTSGAGYRPGEHGTDRACGHCAVSLTGASGDRATDKVLPHDIRVRGRTARQ